MIDRCGPGGHTERCLRRHRGERAKWAEANRETHPELVRRVLAEDFGPEPMASLMFAVDALAEVMYEVNAAFVPRWTVLYLAAYVLGLQEVLFWENGHDGPRSEGESDRVVGAGRSCGRESATRNLADLRS